MNTKIHSNLLRLKTLTEQCVKSQDIFSDEIIVYSAYVGPLLSLERWAADDIYFISIAGGMTNRGATYHHFPVKRESVIAWHEKNISLQALVHDSFVNHGGHLVAFMGWRADENNGVAIPPSVDIVNDFSLYAVSLLNTDPDLYWYVSDKNPNEVSTQYDMNTLFPCYPTQSEIKMKTNKQSILKQVIQAYLNADKRYAAGERDIVLFREVVSYLYYDGTLIGLNHDLTTGAYFINFYGFDDKGTFDECFWVDLDDVHAFHKKELALADLLTRSFENHGGYIQKRHGKWKDGIIGGEVIDASYTLISEWNNFIDKNLNTSQPEVYETLWEERHEFNSEHYDEDSLLPLNISKEKS